MDRLLVEGLSRLRARSSRSPQATEANTRDDDQPCVSLVRKTTLDTLPVETLMEITENLDGPDIMSVRQTSRKMLESAEDAFAKTYFTKRAHVFSRYSIGALAEMTSHPHLMKYLQSIHICTAALDDGYIEDEELWNQDSLKRRAWKKWDRQCSAVLLGDEMIGLLSRVLRNMQALERSPQFLVSNGERVGRIFGMPTLIHDVGPAPDQEVICGPTDAAITALLAAAIDTRYQFSALSLGEQSGAGPDQYLQPRALRGIFESRRVVESASGADIMIRLKKSFGSLDSLGLGFGTTTWYKQDLAMLESLVTSSTHITDLQITCFHLDPCILYDALPLTWLASIASSRSLRKLSIQGGLTTASEICQMLRDQKDTLQELTIRCCKLAMVRCWKYVIRCIQTELKLTRLGMWQLRKGAQHDIFDDREGEAVFAGCSGFEFAGQDVRAGLEKIMAKGFEYEWDIGDGDRDTVVCACPMCLP